MPVQNNAIAQLAKDASSVHDAKAAQAAVATGVAVERDAAAVIVNHAAASIAINQLPARQLLVEQLK